MKKPLLFVAFIMVLCFTTNAQVINGGFETYDPDVPKFDSWNGYNFQVETTDVKSGSQSGRLKAGDSALNQVISVVSGETYDVSFSAKWIDNSGSIKIVFKNGSAKIGETSAIGATSWTTINEQFVVPADVSSLKIVLWKGAGSSPCLLDDVSFTKSTSTSIGYAKSKQIAVSPNPSNGLFNIKGDETLVAYSVYSTAGQLVEAKRIANQDNVILDISNEQRGLYILKLESSNGISYTQKLILN